jgi:hypothetical protein
MVFLSLASGVGPKAHGYTLSVDWKATVRERVSGERRYLGRIGSRALEEASHSSRKNFGDGAAGSGIGVHADTYRRRADFVG